MRNWKYKSEDIIESLGGKPLGPCKEVVIEDTSTADEPQNNSLIFIKTAKWQGEWVKKFYNLDSAFIIIEKELGPLFTDIAQNNLVVIIDNARLYYAKALWLIVDAFTQSRKLSQKENYIIIGENVHIGEGSVIDPFVFIGHDVRIGDNVHIKTGARIRDNTIIGNNVVVGENSVIGAQGFGVETDELKHHIRIPHIGGVVIGDNVEIGALTSIVAGTIRPTFIEDGCLIDDLNHIAHNCSIGQGTLSAACVEISGSATIGKYCYISPNATIRNSVELGDYCFVGQASSVQRSFSSNINVVGNPAKEFVRKG